MGKIVKAQKKDIPKLVEIFREGYKDTPWNENWSLKLATQRITEYFDTNEIYVLKVDREIAGFTIMSVYVWYTGLRGYLDEIVISKKFQGKGYGKKLLDFTEKHFKKQGAKEIALLTSKKSLAYKIYKKRSYKTEENFTFMYKKI